MEIPQEVDDCIKGCIDSSLGLPVSNRTLGERNLILEDSVRRLNDERILLRASLKLMDDSLQKARAEAMLNAQAVKRCIENNEKLAAEVHCLSGERCRLENECSLYEKDREKLMDFGNDAENRAAEANLRVRRLEEELKKLSEELLLNKHQANNLGDSSEEQVFETVVTLLTSEDDKISQNRLPSLSSLKPFSQKLVSLAASLSDDKKLLMSNLRRAEEEVTILDEQIKILKEEKRRRVGSSGKRRGSSSQGKERRIARKIMSPLNFNSNDFADLDAGRV